MMLPRLTVESHCSYDLNFSVQIVLVSRRTSIYD